MKMIFLDIDGVLNDHDFEKERMSATIQRDKVERLNRIIRATDSYIVLTSAWRYLVHRGDMTLQGMEYLLRSHAVIADRLVGITRPDTKQNKTYEWPERGMQITDWRYEWKHEAAYVVIDDLDCGITEAGHFLIKPGSNVGLTDKEAEAAIDWLCRETIGA